MGISLTNVAWTNLGVGPLSVSLSSGGGAFLVASATAPQTGALGAPLGGASGPSSLSFSQALPIWGRAATVGGAQVTVSGATSTAPAPAPVASGGAGITGGGFAPTGEAHLTAATSSSNVALASAGPAVRVFNGGSVTVYVRLGDSSAAATTNDLPIAAGATEALNTNGTATNLAAITASSTAALTITTGLGAPLGWGASGGGGSTTLTGTLPGFAATPTVNIGAAPTITVNWSGQTVGVSSLPALPAGSNVIGGVTQSGGPWTVNHTTLNGVALGSPSNWGTAPSGAVQGVNANVLALPALPSGSNTIGNVGVNNVGVGCASIATAQASVGTTASQIVAARAGAPGTGRHAVTITNNGSGAIYIGNSGVTTSTGVIVQPNGGSRSIDTTAAIYAITASGTQAVDVLETF